MTERRMLMVLHTALALIAPLLILMLSGCDNQLNGESVDYGSEVPFENISDALIEGVREIDPNDTQLGAFVHYSTKQNLAAGKVQSVISDTGLTVIKREVSPEGVVLTVVEKKFHYSQSGNAPQQEEREFQLDFRAPVEAPGSAQALTETLGSVEAVRKSSAEAVQQGTLVPYYLERLQKTLTQDHSSLSTSFAPRTSFHNLVTSTLKRPAPPSIQAKPNCLGLPNCEITLHNISFDQVTRFPDDIERIRFDFYVSPDIPQIAGFNMSPVFPFYQGLFKSCVTLMVPVGDGRSKTLLSECQEVENFRYTVEPTPSPAPAPAQ